MKKILVIAVLLCSFIIIDFARAEEENKSDQIVAKELSLEKYKNILELHHLGGIDPMPNWHKHFLPEEKEDSRCPGRKVDQEGNAECPIRLMEW